MIAEFHVRFWEDCKIDDQEFDEDTADYEDIKELLTRWDDQYKLGLVKDDLVILIIDPETGQVKNYVGGKEIRMFFKVCDECSWRVTERISNGINPYDSYENVVLEVEDDYVPKFLEIDGDGYGDYVEITITSEGFIKNWDHEWFEKWITKESATINGR